MTYGWAILIISSVLAILFNLGVFSSTNLGPRASPGACKVFRNSASTSLLEECTNAIPQYVTQFNQYSLCTSGRMVAAERGYK